MKKSKEQALKAYPDYIVFDDVSKTLEHVRNAYAKGYNQAEQDIMNKAKQNVNERLNEFRNFLISETERYQERAKSCLVVFEQHERAKMGLRTALEKLEK